MGEPLEEPHTVSVADRVRAPDYGLPRVPASRVREAETMAIFLMGCASQGQSLSWLFRR